MSTTTQARLYVGTYAKYNSGSITGKWLTLDDYSDKESFLEACAELHNDESDPEFMFQDFEGFPRALYYESSVSDAIWEWLELDEDDRELLAVYRDNVDSGGDIEVARDRFMGRYDSAIHWAQEWLDESGMLESIPELLRNYFDYEAYARDAACDGIGFIRHDGEVWVFSDR